MKNETRLTAIQEQIKALSADKTIRARYTTLDDSVQAELRFNARWEIRLAVDEITYPRNLAGDPSDLWTTMANLAVAISRISLLSEKRDWNNDVIKINAARKNGPALRAEAKTAWLIESGKVFLAEYRKVTRPANLKKVRAEITRLQAEQKALLPELRAANSAVVLGRKTAKAQRDQANAEALKSGQFWLADKDALKGYFHPPFGKNYLADVSEKWRAALFLECESNSFKLNSGSWGHKLVGTGEGYLCGIDDNGDEWGYVVSNLPQSHDNYDNAALDTTVEEAMAEVFGISAKSIPDCTRQGDLLFCPAKVPGERTVCANCNHEQPEGWLSEWYNRCRFCGFDFVGKKLPPVQLHSAVEWEPRASHILTSSGLSHNGAYFRSSDEITVSHTSHASVTLPAGEYRLYMSRVADPVD